MLFIKTQGTAFNLMPAAINELQNQANPLVNNLPALPANDLLDKSAEYSFANGVPIHYKMVCPDFQDNMYFHFSRQFSG